MAITLVGTPQVGGNNNGGNVTLTFDVAPVQNDVVVVLGGHGVATITLTAPTPATYTSIAEHTGSAPIFGAWYKVMGATPDTNVVCNGGTANQDSVAYVAYVLRGVDVNDVIDVTTTTAGPTTSTNPNPPSITPTTNGAWIIAMAGGAVRDTSPGTLSSPYENNYFQAGTNDTNDITVLTSSEFNLIFHVYNTVSY